MLEIRTVVQAVPVDSSSRHACCCSPSSRPRSGSTRSSALTLASLRCGFEEIDWFIGTCFCGRWTCWGGCSCGCGRGGSCSGDSASSTPLSLLSLNALWDPAQQVFDSPIWVKECSSHGPVDL